MVFRTRPTNVDILCLVIEFIVTNFRKCKEWGTLVSLSANFSIGIHFLVYLRKKPLGSRFDIVFGWLLLPHKSIYWCRKSSVKRGISNNEVTEVAVSSVLVH